MEFNSQWVNRPLSVAEENSGELITDELGYLTAQQQIENLMLAGQRLEAFRRGESFDFPDGNVPEDYDDPTRDPDFDAADAAQYAKNFATQFTNSGEPANGSEARVEPASSSSGSEERPEDIK